MWKNIKTYLSIFVGGAFAGILLFLKLKEGDDSQDALEDAKLQGQEAMVDEDIKGLEDELENIELEDLSDEDISKFWEDV